MCKGGASSAGIVSRIFSDRQSFRALIGAPTRRGWVADFLPTSRSKSSRGHQHEHGPDLPAASAIPNPRRARTYSTALRWPAGKRRYEARETPLPTGRPHGPSGWGIWAPQGFATEPSDSCGLRLMERQPNRLPITSNSTVNVIFYGYGEGALLTNSCEGWKCVARIVEGKNGRSAKSARKSCWQHIDMVS
jgi:hypothetical protein